MSCKIDVVGDVARAVAFTTKAAYSAGFLAYKAGKQVVKAATVIDRTVDEKKEELEEKVHQRKLVAVSEHGQLLDTVEQIKKQLNKESLDADAMTLTKINDLMVRLDQILSETVPEDVSQIENLNNLQYGILKDILAENESLKHSVVTDEGIYKGMAVADLMEDLRIAFSAAQIHDTRGENVVAADPDVLERIELNERLAKVTGRIMSALSYVRDLSDNMGLSDATLTWFLSCFNGIDKQIEQICTPRITNEKLKREIRRLEESMQQFDAMYPAIEENRQRMEQLYDIYRDAALSLAEDPIPIKEFKNEDDLTNALNYLKERSNRAEKCAELYQKLGRSAYICFAWDEELKALGYNVRSRRQITDMALYAPEHGEISGAKLPFYQWKDNELTQIYELSHECVMQLIVHEDGTVSMDTYSDASESDNDLVEKAQASHCSRMKKGI
ncbi:MAG: hypothetical protein VZR00_06995 [Lachnospiraceae bacterium]|nr:hypothetical protein [Lachnospiraceae bacterium]